MDFTREGAGKWGGSLFAVQFELAISACVRRSSDSQAEDAVASSSTN